MPRRLVPNFRFCGTNAKCDNVRAAAAFTASADVTQTTLDRTH
jgi:hypothetical protein